MKSLFFKVLTRILPPNKRWLISQTGFERYFNNTGWLLFAQVFALATSFFVSALVARRLGPEDYGIFNYAFSFVSIFAVFFFISPNSIINRELIKYPEKEKELLGTSLVFKIVGGLLTLLFSSILALFGNFDSLTVKLVVIFSIFFTAQSFEVIALLFQSRVEAKKIALSQVLANFLSSILKIVWVFNSSDLLVLSYIYIADAIFNSLFFIFYYYRSAGRIKTWRFDRLIFVNILRSSLSLMFSGLAILAILKVDQIIIGEFMGKTAVGFYAVADRLTEIWNFIPRLVCLSLFVAIVNAQKTNFEVYKSRLKQLYWLMFFLSLFITVAILVISRPLILNLFGDEYAASINILRVYVLSLPGLFLFTAANQSLVAENREKLILISNLIALSLNVILNFIFLPRFGLIGSAWATVITFVFLPLFMILRKPRAQVGNLEDDRLDEILRPGTS